jgi:hypothetical protein
MRTSGVEVGRSLQTATEEFGDLGQIPRMNELLALVDISALHDDFTGSTKLVYRFLDLVVGDAEELLKLFLRIVLLIGHARFTNL